MSGQRLSGILYVNSGYTKSNSMNERLVETHMSVIMCKQVEEGDGPIVLSTSVHCLCVVYIRIDDS